jgi:hypothetical protein
MIHQYQNLRRDAKRLEDFGDYKIDLGQMNPEIYRHFSLLLESRGAKRVWEQFANPHGRAFHYFPEMEVIATNIEPVHSGVVKMNTIEMCPDGEFQGIIFHPPYFGTKPFTDNINELSLENDFDEWCEKISMAADMAVECLSDDGLVCAVGRRYRFNGKEIRLDELLVEAFCGNGLGGRPMEPQEVWFSEPDIVIIFKRYL